MYIRHILYCLLITCVCAKDLPHFNHGVIKTTNRPLIIGHRGTSGVFPEHTVAAYERAIEDGADVIECDVTITKDLQLICRHETNLQATTDVASRPEFADKKVTRGGVKSWFSMDFTLEELKTLRAVQRYDFRDQSYDGVYPIATFDEFVQVAQNADRPIGIYPELKHPATINSLDILPHGTRFEDILIQELAKFGYTDEDDGCYLQCFYEDSLVYIKEELKSKLPLVMLLGSDVGDSTLDRWADHGFHAVGCSKELVYKHYKHGSYKNYIYQTTNFIEKCHDRGMKVHVYTFRNEDRYLSWDDAQDPYKEYQRFMKKSIEGFFTDFPATLKYFLDSEYGQCDNNTVCNEILRTLSLISSPNDRDWFSITAQPHKRGQDINQLVNGYQSKPNSFRGKTNMDQRIIIEAAGGEEFVVMLLNVKTNNVEKVEINYFNGDTLVNAYQEMIPANVERWAKVRTSYTRGKVTKVVMDCKLKGNAQAYKNFLRISGLKLNACEGDLTD